MKRRIYSLALVFTLIFTSFIFAHPGRTDSRGGHKDSKNVSGLGSYHYHCGDNPAHLHENGICPYNKSTPKPKTTVTTPKKQVPTEKSVNVVVNGTVLSDAYATQKDGRTMVALRPISEALNFSLDWDANAKTAKGQKGTDSFQLTMGNKSAKVNNNSVQLDVPGQIRNGRTLVPVRFIAESLGAVVDFKSSTGAVIITTS